LDWKTQRGERRGRKPGRRRRWHKDKGQRQIAHSQKIKLAAGSRPLPRLAQVVPSPLPFPSTNINNNNNSNSITHTHQKKRTEEEAARLAQQQDRRRPTCVRVKLAGRRKGRERGRGGLFRRIEWRDNARYILVPVYRMNAVAGLRLAGCGWIKIRPADVVCLQIAATPRAPSFPFHYIPFFHFISFLLLLLPNSRLVPCPCLEASARLLLVQRHYLGLIAAPCIISPSRHNHRR
jgi:hypothetical protein